MKTKLIIIAAVFTAAVAFGAAPSLVKVKASKKTADSHHNTAAAGKKSVERSSKDIFYEFEISTMSPAVPEQVKVKWVVAMMDMSGQPHVGTAGEKDLTLPKNKPTVVETEDFSLESKDVRVVRHRASGTTSADDKVLGYGFRVYDDKGTLLSETISPENARKVVTDAFDGKLSGGEEANSRKERKQNRK